MTVPTQVVVERRSLSGDELAVGLRILADLLEAGLPLTRALPAFAAVAPLAWREAVPALTAALREGGGLARAVEDSGLVLPPIVLGLIQAGESGSGLALAMRRAAEHAEATAATRAAVRAALAYPALVALAGCGTIVVMVGVVLPRFTGVLGDLGQTLPPSTRFVLAGADFLGGWGGGAIGAAIGAAVLVIYAARRRPGGRRAIDRLLLQLPGIGTIRWAGATARLSASVAAMLECGVTLRTSLRHATAAVGDAEISARLELARVRLDAGDPLGRSLDELGVVTPLAARLVSAGEESGRLPGMFAFAARLEQSRADRLTRTGVRLIEPGLIFAFAAVVGLVAIAMLQAVYSVRPI